MSFISEQHGIAFIHVPKTGGRSIKSCLGSIGSGHVPAKELLRSCQVPFSFGFVRNPYDRLVSLFHAAVQHGGTWPQLSYGSFASFVRRLPANWQIKPHALPMTTFLCADDGRILVDFIGRYEDFDDDWNKICERIGIEHTPLPQMHKSDHNAWQAYYTPELIEIVDEVYKDDFRAFGYGQYSRSGRDKRPFLSCICPTYKRPDLLQNSLACFLGQEYPESRCELIILDDAAQFDQQNGTNWKLVSLATRYPTLPDKFNSIVEKVNHRSDLIVLWEDDEIYCPGHLEAIANAWEWSGRNSKTFFAPSSVWSTYGMLKGKVQIENAQGRFHSSWAMTGELFDAVGGYPQTGELCFDRRMGQQLAQSADVIVHYDDPTNPTFVYRWGNGVYHGSQAGDDGYSNLWQQLGSRDAPWVGRLVPRYDAETIAILEKLRTF